MTVAITGVLTVIDILSFTQHDTIIVLTHGCLIRT